jgi:hypothetical protein
MISPVWRKRIAEAWAVFLFLGRASDDTKKDDELATWEADVRSELGKRDDATLDAFAARWQSRYDEIEATRGTVNTRANSLLIFVGVLATAAGLVVQSMAGAPVPILILLVVFGVPLFYSWVAAVTLAVRAQRVTRWDSPRVDISDAIDARSARLKYAAEIYVAAEQNGLRLRAPVGILRDGQLYAIVGIFLIATIVALSVTATIAKSPGVGQASSPPAPSAPTATPTLNVPSPSPSPSHSPSPSPSASPSPLVSPPPSPAVVPSPT